MKKPIYARMYDYDKRLLPNPYLASLEKDVFDIEQSKEKTGFTIGYPGWNLLYYSLLGNLKKDTFNVIIETGTNWGCSTIMLAQALKDSGLSGQVYSVELEEENFIKASHNIKKAGVDNVVTLYHQDSIQFLEQLPASIETVRYVFLDGNHEKKHFIHEFELIYPYLDDTSMVAMDNTHRLTAHRVNEGLRQIKARYGGNLINFENVSWYTPGLALWQKDPFAKDWVE